MTPTDRAEILRLADDPRRLWPHKAVTILKTAPVVDHSQWCSDVREYLLRRLATAPDSANPCWGPPEGPLGDGPIPVPQADAEQAAWSGLPGPGKWYSESAMEGEKARHLEMENAIRERLTTAAEKLAKAAAERDALRKLAYPETIAEMQTALGQLQSRIAGKVLGDPRQSVTMPAIRSRKPQESEDG